VSTYAIGDIHGCLEELRVIIETLRREENLQLGDALVFVGDYVDRGPDSKGVIDYLIELSRSQHCIFLMGNHEDMMLWWLNIQHGNNHTESVDAARYASVWIPNGGDETLISYGVDVFSHHSGGRTDAIRAIPRSHIEFLKDLRYHYIDGSNLYVHAGVSSLGLEAETPQEAVERSTNKDLLWDRTAFKLRNNFGTIIYGHTPNKSGIRWHRREDGPPHSVGVDVGCVFDCNPLVAVRTDDWTEIWPG